MASQPPSQESPSAPPLWPAPLFVLGVAALATVWLGRPLFPDAVGPARDLDAARRLLAQPNGDAEQAIALARRALDRGGPLEGEAALLLGTAHARLAEKADPAHAPDAWKRSREFLALAEAKGVASDDDKAALGYRIARADFHTGGDLDDVVRRLEAVAGAVEAKSEAYDLLARAYLRLPRPNLDKAYEANANLRAVPDLTAADLAAAQLMGGEILLLQNNPKDARETLRLIRDEHASPAVLLRARLLRARCHQDEKQYQPAVDLYLAAMKDGAALIPRRASVYYNLGLCLRELGKMREATEAWRECVRQAQGEEAQAASIVLAEIGLLEPPSDAVIEHLDRAVAPVDSPAKWKNMLVDLNRARMVFEQAITVYRNQARYDLALRVLEPYGKLADRPRALEWKAALSSEWARARREKPDPAGERETSRLFAEAAGAFAEYARTPGLTPKQVADNLWAAVCCHLSAGAGEPAARLLERLVTMDLEQGRMGEAWYLLGEEYRSANDPKKAESAYQESLKYVTKFAYSSRYQLAMAALGRGEIDAAIGTLRQNLTRLDFEGDVEARSQSLLALCDLLYGRRAYAEVINKLEQAVSHPERFRDAGSLAKARYQLADSYHQLASRDSLKKDQEQGMTPEAKAHIDQERRTRQRRAAEEFARLDALLDTAEGKELLTAEQRQKVPFVTAKCWFHLGEYDTALAVYERLIEKHEGRVESLDALGGAVACHAAKGDKQKVEWRLLQVATAVERVPEEYRKPWRDWVEETKEELSKKP